MKPSMTFRTLAVTLLLLALPSLMSANMTLAEWESYLSKPLTLPKELVSQYCKHDDYERGGVLLLAVRQSGSQLPQKLTSQEKQSIIPS